MRKYCERGAYIAVCQLKEEDGPLSPSWEVLRVLSAKRNYNIIHQEGDDEIIADFYSDSENVIDDLEKIIVGE